MAKDTQIVQSGGEIIKSGICEITGKTVEVRVTEAQYQSWRDGALIQRAMPQLNNAEREFLMTGITEPEWEALFKGHDEEMEISR